MTTKIRRLGGSWGIVIPKSMLQEVGIEENAEIAIEHGAIVLRQPSRNPRPGWADASRKLVQAGDDILVLTEFGNRCDRTLQW